jgi:hypothetical protein
LGEIIPIVEDESDGKRTSPSMSAFGFTRTVLECVAKYSSVPNDVRCKDEVCTLMSFQNAFETLYFAISEAFADDFYVVATPLL